MPLIEVPDFEFSGFYYPEILADIITFLRQSLPEISDEDPVEPSIQLARAFALSAHLNNVLLDIVARERFLPTAELRESVRAHLALIGVDLAQATPATVGLILQLSRAFSSDSLVVSAHSIFSSTGNAESAAIPYEVLSDVSVTANDRPSSVMSYDASTDTWTVHVYNAEFVPWAGVPAAGDCLYIGHLDTMWDTLKLTLGTGSTGISGGVWEFYDGSYNDAAPTIVTNPTGKLTLDLTGWLGTADRTGTVVRVKCLLTGIYQDGLVVYYAGGVNKVDTNPAGLGTGTLGQASPSPNVNDYVVGSLWQELPGIASDAWDLSSTGIKTIAYTLPQSTVYRWVSGAVGAEGVQVTAYWIRYRVISAAGATSPHPTLVNISSGKLYIYALGVQGESFIDSPLGSSDGFPSAVFTLSRSPVIDSTDLKFFATEGGVEEEWTRVSNFLNSLASDKHFVVSFSDDGHGYITTGDGINGKIPAPGSDNLRSSYRVMQAADGNLGPNEVTVNTAGVSYVSRLWNPRAAAGYAAAEGSTPADLARVKVSGPASLRVQGRGVTRNDIENLAEIYISPDGTNPCVRALCVEEGYGPKTAKLVVVGTGGTAVEPTILTELETYFNGDIDAGVEGVLLLNTQLTAVNYTPHPVNVTAAVYGGTLDAVTNALAALLLPNAVRSDGGFEWEFGEEIPHSRLVAAIMGASTNIRKVVVSVPSTDLTLGAEELPVSGVFSITMYP